MHISYQAKYPIIGVKIFLLLQSKKFFPLSIVLFFIFKKFFFTLLFRYKYI